MDLKSIREYFDSLAHSWDEGLCADPEKINSILDAGEISQGHRVVDIACGTGVLFGHILKRQPCFLMGVDASGGMAQIARSKFSDERLKVASRDFLCIDEGGFDRAVLYNAYPHFFDKAALAKKIHDVLGRKGRFVLAHSQGRRTINCVHKSRMAKSVSVPLKEAELEKKWFEPFFDIDVLTDTQELYIISGAKRK